MARQVVQHREVRSAQLDLDRGARREEGGAHDLDLVADEVHRSDVVDVDGDRATCKMYMKAEHFLQNDQGNDDFALGGYYTDQLEKQDGSWLINAVTLKIFWNRGNRHIMTMGYERGSERLGL